MRKILCLSCFFCPPAMAHSRFEGGDMLFASFGTSLIIFIVLFLTLFILRVLYLSLSKSDRERENAGAFAFYTTNILLSAVAVVGAFISIFVAISNAFKDKSDVAFNSGHSAIVKFLDVLGMFSLGFAPYYLILLLVYGTILAFNRISKKNNNQLENETEYEENFLTRRSP